MPFPRDLKNVFIFLTVPILVGLLAAAVTSTSRKTETYAESSARRALFAEISQRTQDYINENHCFPESITSLNITNFPDGSSPLTLAHIQYTIDGESCELRCESLSQSRTLVSQFELKDR